MTKYFNTLKSLWQDLDMFNDYEWKCPEYCNYYMKHVESTWIFNFLVGLNMDLNEVRGGIICRRTPSTLGEVFSKGLKGGELQKYYD